jgi:hypothetical protein
MPIEKMNHAQLTSMFVGCTMTELLGMLALRDVQCYVGEPGQWPSLRWVVPQLAGEIPTIWLRLDDQLMVCEISQSRFPPDTWLEDYE